MASTRAPAVAEVLWELKRADKVATFTSIASRAGFSAGANGRAMMTCLKTIRKDWPHLQWWRAIRDDATVKLGGEQANLLLDWGLKISSEADDDGGRGVLEIEESLLMVWEPQPAAVGAK